MPYEYIALAHHSVSPFVCREEHESEEEGEEEGKPLTQEELRARALRGVSHVYQFKYNVSTITDEQHFGKFSQNA